MKTMNLTPEAAARPAALSRRALLVASAAAVPLAMGLGNAQAASAAAPAAAPPVAAPTAEESAAFQQLSAFLTNKPQLDGTLAARYLAALLRHDAQFKASLGALQAFIGGAKAENIDALLALPGLDTGLKKTMQEIVGAWYLGVVGDGADAELIAYGDALMYVPTKAELVIPTYGGGPDSWGPKPGPAGAAL